MPMSKSRKKKPPKRVLALRDLARANNGRFEQPDVCQRPPNLWICAWYCSEPRSRSSAPWLFGTVSPLEQGGYAPTTINLRLAAVRRIAYEAADAGLLSRELAAGIRRTDWESSPRRLTG